MEKILIIILIILSSFSYLNNPEKTNDKKIKTIITVVDSITNEVLTGVLVTIKELDTSFYTDFNGEISFEAIPNNFTINFDFISYKNKEIKINTQNKEKIKVPEKLFFSIKN